MTYLGLNMLAQAIEAIPIGDTLGPARILKKKSIASPRTAHGVTLCSQNATHKTQTTTAKTPEHCATFEFEISGNMNSLAATRRFDCDSIRDSNLIYLASTT